MAQQPQTDPWEAEAAKMHAAPVAGNAAPSGDDSSWKIWQQGGGDPSTSDDRNSIQKSFDENTKTNPKEPPLETGLKSVVGAVGTPFIHPMKTLDSMGDMINPDVDQNPLVKMGKGVEDDYKSGGLGYAGAKLAGNVFGGAALGGAGEAGLGEASQAIPKMGTAVRDAAIGDTDVAALRGLRVAPTSNKIQRVMSNVETARPYLQGAQSLEDLQQRIPQAKSEIWAPYQDTISQAGHTKVMGPDGPTTIADLENERLQLSALNRGLKTRDPEALQLAQQQGMSQADLLQREQAVKSALDPALSKFGIDPQGIRKNFGSVSQLGGMTNGESTILEKPQAYGLSKMAGADFSKPASIPGTIGSGLRDIVAGRPLFRGSPTDVGIREGFRNAGAKPNLGAYQPPVLPKMLMPDVVGNADFGEDAYPGSLNGIPARGESSPFVTPPPARGPMALPENSGAGDVQPMVGVRAPSHPGVAEGFAKTRIDPTRFAAPGPVNANPFEYAPSGEFSTNQRALPMPEPEILKPTRSKSNARIRE